MREHNKLVRDGIPGVIERNGERAVYRTLDAQEFRLATAEKLLEETKELCEAKGRSEFLLEAGDVEEIYQAVINAWKLAVAVSLCPVTAAPLCDEPEPADALLDRAHVVAEAAHGDPSQLPRAAKDFRVGFEELLELKRVSLPELEYWRKKRFEDSGRGGFDKRIFLIKTIDAGESA